MFFFKPTISGLSNIDLFIFGLSGKSVFNKIKVPQLQWKLKFHTLCNFTKENKVEDKCGEFIHSPNLKQHKHYL